MIEFDHKYVRLIHIAYRGLGLYALSTLKKIKQTRTFQSIPSIWYIGLPALKSIFIDMIFKKS